MNNTYYDILEIKRDASPEVIRAAYKILAQKYHPDKNSSEEAEEKMKLVNTAYDVLSNEEKRESYNFLLEQQEKANKYSQEDEIRLEEQKKMAQKERLIKEHYEKMLQQKNAQMEQLKSELDFNSTPTDTINANYVPNNIQQQPYYYPQQYEQPVYYSTPKVSKFRKNFAILLYALTLFIIIDFFFSLSGFNYKTAAKKTLPKSPITNQTIDLTSNQSALSQIMPKDQKKETSNNNENKNSNYLIGFTKFNSKNYSEALQYFYLASKEGNHEASNQIGFMYLNGFGVEKNAFEAAKWFNLSAKNGNINGQFNLGYLYFYGYGVSQNTEIAIQLFSSSSEKGHIEAKKMLDSIKK